MTDTTSEHPLISAERVNGSKVYAVDGEKLGKVKDLAIDKLSGQVAFAILGPDGLLDQGRRFRPVAWSLLTYDPDKRGYVVPVTREELERSEPLDETELGGWTTANNAMFI